jgi:uncharacterized FlaG/YvyC family protein
MEVYSIKSQGNDGYFGSSSPSFIIQKQERINSPTESKSDKKITTANKAKAPRVKKATIVPDYPRMTEIAHKVRDKLQSIDVNIQFEVNKESNRIVIMVIDPESGEIVRKIPPEKYMKAVELFNDMKNELHAQGIEIDVKY